jgi:hypothetical protein
MLKRPPQLSGSAPQLGALQQTARWPRSETLSMADKFTEQVAFRMADQTKSAEKLTRILDSLARLTEEVDADDDFPNGCVSMWCLHDQSRMSE